MNFLFSLLIGIILGVILTILIEITYKFTDKYIKKDPIIKFKRLHIHHSTLGLLLIPTLFIAYSTLLFGLSLGIIIRHTHNEKFIFIERIKH